MRKQTSLLTLAAAAKYTPYSADYLNLLVRRGKLPAKKIGRNWYTSKAAIRWYLARRSPSKQTAMMGSPEVHPITRSVATHHYFSLATPLRWLAIALALFLLLLLIFPELVFGMSSPNYRLDQTFVGSGGPRESSGNYQVIETVGDIGTGNSGSNNYRLRAGYLPGAGEARLIFNLSTSNLSLGTISPAAVASATHTMTVTADLTRGYVITAQANHTLMSGANSIPYVADGTVTAGSAEYGAAFTGGGGSHPAGDIGLGSQTTVTSFNDNAGSGDTTTATYKASASTLTPSGTYSSTTTYVATATF